MTDQRVLRAAVIGLGVGRAHMRGYQSNPNAELTAICDADSSRVEMVGDEFHVPANGRYTDFHKLLTDVQPDIVSIALPNYLHAEVTIAALEAGAHVICEKPMAPSIAEAERMIAAAQKADRKLIMCYNYRFRPDVQWMHKVIAAGQLGDIHHVHATWRRETGIPGSGWFGRKAMSGGGAMIDLGVHVLDMTLWFLGFPAVQTVSGGTRSLFGQHGLKTWGRKPGPVAEFDVDDGAIGFLRFANGANAVIQATWAEHRQPQDDMIRIEVQGTLGTILLTIPNYRHEDTLRMFAEIEGEPVTIIPSLRGLGKTQGHEALVSATVDALLNDTPLPSNGEQGLAAVRVLEALYQSAAQGHEVALEAV